jgi:hypothetical protein
MVFDSWRKPNVPTTGLSRPWWVAAVSTVVIVLLLLVALSWYWSREPKIFWVNAAMGGNTNVSGYATTDTLIKVADFLLEKPGGFLSNDIGIPGLFLDNMPNFEFGVLVQSRDLARVLRNDYSRSQSQSTENIYLAEAEPKLNYDNTSWILPASESMYRDGIEELENYRDALVNRGAVDAQFYARADNLREWLVVVEKRLGSLSQRLSASVGQVRVNTDLAGEPDGGSATPRPENIDVKTPWLEIDDVFYEARGTAWALVHFLRAAQFDFADVLEKKNATVSLRQIVRELETSLEPISSPIILNGRGYGFFANHSLVMTSYLSRANSAIIDLRELLAQG